MSSTANPTRQKATEHKDPLVAAAQQKVDEAKQKLQDLQAATKAANEEVERNEAKRNLLRQAVALQEAEVTQRNEELTITRDETQQQIDRINAALNGVSDEPEPATPDEPATDADGEVESAPADPGEPSPQVVDHDAEPSTEASQPSAEEDDAEQDRKWAAAIKEPSRKPSLMKRWNAFRDRLL
jgi:chromosome segregation ATPase